MFIHFPENRMAKWLQTWPPLITTTWHNTFWPIHSHLITQIYMRYINRPTLYKSKCSMPANWFHFTLNICSLLLGFDCPLPLFGSFDLAYYILLLTHRLTFACPWLCLRLTFWICLPELLIKTLTWHVSQLNVWGARVYKDCTHLNVMAGLRLFHQLKISS